ncbi:MAG: YgcG family protein [Betaproteobacteria bacterium]|nr:YgcG family protein [Betaproteobacteria bacterium]
MLRALLSAALAGLLACTAAAQVAVPQLKSRVTDMTRTLPAQSVMQLEQRLAAFEREKGTQVAVLLVPTVRPDSIEQYAVRVFEQWRLGRKGVDDGVLLVVAKNDRELRIEVGYGLEGVLTDATSNRIINDDIVPHFKRGEFAAGVEAGVVRILKVAGGEPLPPPATRSQRNSSLPFAPEWLIAIFVFLQVINQVLRTMLGRVLAASVLAALTGGVVWVIFHSVLAAVIGSVVVFVASIGDGTRGGRGGWSSGGGAWSSGSGGGGFSGGGGRSGGGGASGRW